MSITKELNKKAQYGHFYAYFYNKRDSVHYYLIKVSDDAPYGLAIEELSVYYDTQSQLFDFEEFDTQLERKYFKLKEIDITPDKISAFVKKTVDIAAYDIYTKTAKDIIEKSKPKEAIYEDKPKKNRKTKSKSSDKKVSKKNTSKKPQIDVKAEVKKSKKRSTTKKKNTTNTSEESFLKLYDKILGYKTADCGLYIATEDKRIKKVLESIFNSDLYIHEFITMVKGIEKRCSFVIICNKVYITFVIERGKLYGPLGAI